MSEATEPTSPVEPMSGLHSEQYDRVLQECERWGVEVVHAPPVDDWAHPGQLATDTWLAWRERIIYQPSPHAIALLHELGHAVIGIDPHRACEIDDGVFAFELYGQRSLGLWQPQDAVWQRWMSTHGIWEPMRSQTVVFFEASSAAVEAELRQSLAGAVRLGVLTADGSPTYRPAPVQVERAFVRNTLLPRGTRAPHDSRCANGGKAPHGALAETR